MIDTSASIPSGSHVWNDFVADLQHQGQFPPGQDLRVGAYARAMHWLVTTTDLMPGFEAAFQARIENGQNLPGSLISNIGRYALQKQFLPIADEIGFPERHTRAREWLHSLGHFSRTASAKAQDTLNFDLRTRNNPRNVPARYKPVQLIRTAYKERFDHPLQVLDIGCSQNHGLKQLALQHVADTTGRTAHERQRYDFAPTTVVDEVGNVDQVLSEHISQMTNSHDAYGPSLGVDMWPQPDEETRLWARSARLTSEFLDVDKMAAYDELDSVDVPNVNYIDRNFSRPEEAADIPDGASDLVMFSTVLYQLNAEKRAAMLAHAKTKVHEDGLIIVQDHVELDPDAPDGLHFTSLWYGEAATGYRTLVLDMRRPEAGFEEFAHYNNGSLGQATLNPSSVAVRSLLA